MLHACAARFDVTGNLEKFLRTKQGLNPPSAAAAATLLGTRDSAGSPWLLPSIIKRKVVINKGFR